MTAPVLPAQFTVEGDFRDYEAPPLTGNAPDLDFAAVNAYVDFIPRVPADFEVFVANLEVVPPTNAVQQINIAGPPTGGTWTLSYNGTPTTALAYNAQASDVQAALQAIPAIGVGNVSVVSDGTWSYVVTFQGALAAQPIANLVANQSQLTGAPFVEIGTVTNGGNGYNEVQQIDVVNATSGTYALAFRGQTTTALGYNANAIDIQNALAALSTIGAGNIAVNGPSGGPYVCTFQGSLANTDLPVMTWVALTTSPLGGGVVPTISVWTTTTGSPAIGRDAGVAISPLTARILNGQLSTIDATDALGVKLLANDPMLNLATNPDLQALNPPISTLIYDVRFREVQYAGAAQILKNFAFTAPTGATTINLADPTLTRLPYAPLQYDWQSPYS